MQNERRRTGAYPVSPEHARVNLRLPDDVPDEELTVMIGAATEYCESYTGRAYCDGVVTAWPDDIEGLVRLPYTPIREVSVKVYDKNGTAHSVASQNVCTYSEGIVVTELPNVARRSFEPYEVVYTTGAEEAPLAVVQAILQLVNHFYDNRSAVIDGNANTVPYTVERLLRQYKRWWA